MVVVLEDLHWAAPTTLAVAEYLGDKLSKAGSAAAPDRHRMPRCRQSTGFTPTVRTSMRAGAADVARRKIAAMSATTSSGAATPKARARPTVPISHQELRAHVHCVARRHPICLMTAQIRGYPPSAPTRSPTKCRRSTARCRVRRAVAQQSALGHPQLQRRRPAKHHASSRDFGVLDAPDPPIWAVSAVMIPPDPSAQIE